jgi:hypothetical protein
VWCGVVAVVGVKGERERREVKRLDVQTYRKLLFGFGVKI